MTIARTTILNGYVFLLNLPHWADSVIELPCPSVKMCVVLLHRATPSGAVIFFPLIGQNPRHDQFPSLSLVYGRGRARSCSTIEWVHPHLFNH